MSYLIGFHHGVFGIFGMLKELKSLVKGNIQIESFDFADRVKVPRHVRNLPLRYKHILQGSQLLRSIVVNAMASAPGC